MDRFPSDAAMPVADDAARSHDPCAEACAAVNCSAQACATRPLCFCMRVMREQVADAIAVNDLQTVRQVTVACGAGGGCTSCHRHIKRLLADHASQQTDVNAQVAVG